MIIEYSSKKQKQLYDSSKKLTRRYGSENARKIRMRMDDLDSAINLDEMQCLPGHTHELHGNRAGTFSIELHKGWRLIFEPVEDPPPLKKDGGLSWTEITEIRILDVEDYHD
jgi:plasmid maintenance system killer protein